MKNIDLGQMVTILANLGVIAGIIFLAVELQQNNSLLEAQAGYNLMQNKLGHTDRLQENSEYAELMAKFASGEPLTAAEELRIAARYQESFVKWQWEFDEALAGRVPVGNMPVEGFRQRMRGEGLALSAAPRALEYWEQVKTTGLLTPEFIQWMQENVLDH